MTREEALGQACDALFGSYRGPLRRMLWDALDALTRTEAHVCTTDIKYGPITNPSVARAGLTETPSMETPGQSGPGSPAACGYCRDRGSVGRGGDPCPACTEAPRAWTVETLAEAFAGWYWSRHVAVPVATYGPTYAPEPETWVALARIAINGPGGK